MPETPEKAATTSPKTSPSKKEIDAATMALNNFAQGKRHLVVGDIPSAVNSLQEACKLLAEQYGETAPECGDAYFCYGKALLEMARIENGVIGNALEGVPEGDDADNSQVSNPEKMTDTEKGAVTELVDKALEENFESLETKRLSQNEEGKEAKVNGHSKHSNMEVQNGAETAETKENGKLDVEMEAKNKKAKAAEGETDEQNEGSTENEEEDSEGDADSQEGESQDGESQEGEAQEGEEQGENDENKDEIEGEKTEDDDEEVSNLQLSWEMLELAKVIFQKQQDTNPKMKEKVAEVYLKLGEVGLESENYPQGIEDFKQCLEIQKNVLKSDDRCIAETHYQLGIAYSFCDEFDLATESFNAAFDVLSTRITNLEKLKKEREEWTEEQRQEDAVTRVDPFYTEQGEIDEINKLLPEIQEKIVDMKQMKKDSHERIKAAKEAMLSNAFGGESSSGFGGPSTSSSSSTAEAKPIMIVRKKRKNEEEGSEEAKKVKGENGESPTAVNGSKDSQTKIEELKEKAAEDMKKTESRLTS